VLYLAEVQKQKGGLLGGGAKTELKLLASQKNDQQGWSQVPEEAIATEEGGKLNDGALVLVELNPNRQVQRIQEAGRPLVNILQNFSRQVEKFKVKEEEIDQWKESLTFQAQELNRREIEMEERSAHLQQLQEECQGLEVQRQEFETKQQEIDRLKEEIERKTHELEGAWEHLRGEQRRLEESQAEFQSGMGLNEEQSRTVSELLNRLSNSTAPTETLREHLNSAFEVIETQQATLNPYWQQLEEQKTLAQQHQLEFEQLSASFYQSQNEWQQAQNSLYEQTAELKGNTAVLSSKQEYAQILKQQLRHQEDLYQQICSLAAMSGDVVLRQQVDVEALQNMSLEELQKTVQDLQEKLDIDSSFVNDQEQELKYKQDTIDEIQQKLNQASPGDRAELEIELADEKDLFEMLNESLVGQRRSLVERQESLRQHQAVLLRRQGNTPNNTKDDNNIDLKPVLAQIEAQRQEQLEELQRLEREIDQIRSGIELDQGMIDNSQHELNEKRQELKVMEENLYLHKAAMAESGSRVDVYQETLQPIQDGLSGLQNNLQAMADSLAQVQETGDYQLQAVNEMRQTLEPLISLNP
jgi:chromosome segregation ATPase